MRGRNEDMFLRPGAEMVRRGDARYGYLLGRGVNRRFTADPDAIYVVGAPDQVPAIVEAAVGAGRRIAVRSGGHCFENFVDDPGVDVIVDVSEMNAVYFDDDRGAFAVESGATLGGLYRTLFLGWGVTVPAGRCPGVGVGGHIAGGGGGALSRQLGLSVDYLHAVEVVVVDAAGRARTVVATREPTDPHHDLWWGHTGAGGGNFGVVTRYWFRSPDAEGSSPARLLPAPPAALLKGTVHWPWPQLDEQRFARLVGNFCRWHQRHGAPGGPGAQLDNSMTLPRPSAGPVSVECAIDAARSDAHEQLDRFIAAVNDGVGLPPQVEVSTTSWLATALMPDEFAGITGRFKSKAAFLRAPLNDAQLATIYRYLADPDYDNPAAAMYLLSYGGQVNAVGPDATAMAHRDCIMKTYWSTFWFDDSEDDKHLHWIRTFYHDVFADAGGVPDPDAGYGGAFINYADTDLADTQINRSGVAWQRLYFRDNCTRLQQIKRRWDPLDVFGHRLSIRPR
jgi:aclacinomycin oxidase